MRLRDPGERICRGRVALAAVIERAVWLDIGDGRDRGQTRDLKRDQRLDLIRRKRSLVAAEAGAIVIAGVRANLHPELAAAPGGRDRDRGRAGVDATRHVGAVDAGEDRLVFAGALTDIGVEIHSWCVSPWSS